jgi:large repetitive protein
MAPHNVPFPEAETAKQEIAFIDTSVSGYQTLLDGLKPDVEIVLIDPARDGLAQIAAALAGRSDIAAVHIFAHGAPGALQLGAAHLSLDNIADRAGDLAVVGAALAAEGDLMIYGCDVAEGTMGEAFIRALSSATGADVAASTNVTGNAAQNADWVLEAQTGSIDTAVALTAAGQQAFAGTLAIGDENFDALGLIISSSNVLTAGNWKFTSVGNCDMAVADSNEFAVYLNTDGGAGDRAVILNYSGTPSVTTFTMGSNDGSNFQLNSFKIGQSPLANQSVTIAGYSNGVQVVAPESVDLSASDSTGNISYSRIADDPNGRYGTLTFNSQYNNIDEIRFVFSSLADLHIDDIDVSAVVSDTTAPVFSSASVNGATLVMTYTDANLLDANNVPGASSFAVMAGGSAVTVNSVAVNAAAKTVTLTLASPVANGQAVTIAYTDPTAGNDTNAIQDASGNDAVTLSATSVTNNTPDTTAPVFVSAAVDGATLVMAYSDANTLDATNVPATSRFTVMAGGSSVAVSSVAVDSSNKTVTLTLASAVLSGQAVTVAYTDPTAGNDANAIQDSAGNDAATLLATSVNNNTLDTTPPSVSGNIAVPSNGAYGAGATLDFTVTFDESVSVTGTDSTLGLTVGSTARHADYLSKTVNSITYTYAVQAGDADADGIVVGAISPGSTTIRDAAGNDASLALGGHVPSTAGVLVDTTAPAVSGNIAVPAAATYHAGQPLSFTVTFDESVTVTGTDSALGLTIGGSVRSASYASKAANSITYTYTLQAGEADGDGISVGSIALGSSTVRDAAGNDANLDLTGHVPSTASVLVDAVAPAVAGNIAVPADDTYIAGDTLSFTVSFDENVTVTGTDSTLGLTIGGVARSAAYSSGSGGTVTYTYTVQAGDLDADGIAVGAIALGSSTIRDAAGNDAGLSLSGHVPATTGVLVDTAGPDFLNATVNGATLVLNYADTGMLDAAHPPVAGAFTVMAAGSAVAVTALAVNGAARTVTLTLASPVANGAAVTVAYGDPTGANDINAVQDAGGNDAASLIATAVANNTPAPDVTPAAVPKAVDGVTVQVGTVVNSDGSSSHTVTVPVVTSTRVEEIGNNTVADIPLVEGADGVSLIKAQVPVGFGLQVTGFAQPKTAGNSLTDLIREIQAHTAGGSHDQTELTGGGGAFLGQLSSDTPLIVQTIVPTAASDGTMSTTERLAIVGTPVTSGNAYTALVIDARGLPAATTIELHDVEFAAVIGAVSVTGGTGSQNVWGDGASQYIMLGADDDILHGGAGNDTVGSAGGDDQIFGDEGDDVVFGGQGSDTIDGGTGHDTLLLAGANRSDYSMRVSGGKLVMTQLNTGPDGADVVTNVEALRFANALSDTSAYGTAGRLVESLTGGQASLETLDAMTTAARKGATLQDIAHALYGQSGAAAHSDDAFVQMLYQNTFHRAADAGGFAFWTARLQAGTQRADVALAVANSAQKLAMAPADSDFNATDVATLVRMYGTLFDRRPDAAGLNYWIGAHEGGMAMADIAGAFVATAESGGMYGGMNDAQFVNALYQSALHRQASGSEVKGWTDALANGQLDRGDVLLGFANSAEKVALVGNISTSIDTL